MLPHSVGYAGTACGAAAPVCNWLRLSVPAVAPPQFKLCSRLCALCSGSLALPRATLSRAWCLWSAGGLAPVPFQWLVICAPHAYYSCEILLHPQGSVVEQRGAEACARHELSCVTCVDCHRRSTSSQGASLCPAVVLLVAVERTLRYMALSPCSTCVPLRRISNFLVLCRRAASHGIVDAVRRCLMHVLSHC